MWVALPLIMIATLLVMKLAAFGEMKGNIAKQFEIFNNKHTWSMTALYLVTFGSFIGFSMALPLSITVIFGDTHVLDAATGTWVHAKNPNAPPRCLRLDRPLRRRTDPPGGRLDLRQGRRLHRHPDHLGGDGGGFAARRLRDDAGLQIGNT
jgi:hypothetical protein